MNVFAASAQLRDPHAYRRPRLVLLVLVTAAICAPAVGDAERVYVHGRNANTRGQLYLVEADTGEIAPVGLPTGVGIASLTLGPDGSLYGIGGSVAQGPNGLYRIDPENGTPTRIGSLNLNESFDHSLVFDGQGRLWAATSDTLFRVDPMTAATTAVATFPRVVTALAARGDRVYAFTGDYQTGLRHLEEIDLESYALVPLFVLEIDWDIVDAATDRLGRLRFLVRGGGIPEYVLISFYLISDIAAGTVVETHSVVYDFREPLAGMRALSGLPPGVVAEVPAVGTAGAALLALALAALSIASLRRV